MEGVGGRKPIRSTSPMISPGVYRRHSRGKSAWRGGLIDHARQLSVRDEGDARDRKPDDRGDDFDDRFAGPLLDKSEPQGQDAERETDPYQPGELFVKSGDVLRAIPGKALAHPAGPDLVHLD